jgi:hypothetical protein
MSEGVADEAAESSTAAFSEVRARLTRHVRPVH